MSRLGNDDQFKFLISCIRYSNNGKVDFGEVANECNIVSKGAAAKRYERMMKSHGIAPNAASVKSPRGVKREKDSSSKGSPSKKSKDSGDFNSTKGSSVDDEERFSVFSPIKSESSNTDNQQDSRVKKETDIFSNSMLDNDALLQYMPQLEQSTIDSYGRTGFEDNLSTSFPSHNSPGYSSPLDVSHNSSSFSSSLPQTTDVTYSPLLAQHSGPRYSSPLIHTSGFSSPLVNAHNANSFSSPSNSSYDISPPVSYPHVEYSGGLNSGRMQPASAQNDGYSGQSSIILD